MDKLMLALAERMGAGFYPVQLPNKKRKNEDGDPGSGNWGHEGRPGKVGGSWHPSDDAPDDIKASIARKLGHISSVTDSYNAEGRKEQHLGNSDEKSAKFAENPLDKSKNCDIIDIKSPINTDRSIENCDAKGQRNNGNWITINGAHILIDEGGMIVNGPDHMIGKSIGDVGGKGGKKREKPKTERSKLPSSATGANEPCTGFRDKNAVKAHRKHWKEFGVSSNAEYEKLAIDFIKQPVGGNIDGYLRERDDAVIRFDVSTGELGIGIPGREMITYFKARYSNGKVNLTAANNYFNALKKKEQYEQDSDETSPLPGVQEA